MSSKSLAKTMYQKLLDDLSAIYDRAMKELGAATENILNKAYREIGRHLVEVEQRGEIRAEYGSRLLQNISNDLTKTGRKGFSADNLERMRRVYLAFPKISATLRKLTWSHCVVLSSIKDDQERKNYAGRVVKEDWSVDELRERLKHDQVEFIQSFSQPNTPASKDVKVIRLAEKRGLVGLYPVTDVLVDRKKTAVLDLGFKSYHAVPEHLKNKVKAGDILKFDLNKKASSLEIFKDKNVNAKHLLYTFAGSIDMVIDGDTIKVVIHLGFDLWAVKKLRLRKVNAPEINTKRGEEAKGFVERTLKSVECFVIKTYSTDIYDRYLADVFYLPGCDDPYKIAAHGVLLNQELIDQGLADLWQMPDPADLAFMN